MAFSDSEVTVGTLNLTGVWIHDPDNAQETVKWYPYGNAGGGMSINVEQGAQHYAGRQYPVVDYGEFQDDVMTVSIQVVRNDPYFPDSGSVLDLARFAQARQAFMIRDGDGRLVTGSLEGWQEQQAGVGIQQVSFSVRQVDQLFELVAV